MRTVQDLYNFAHQSVKNTETKRKIKLEDEVHEQNLRQMTVFQSPKNRRYQASSKFYSSPAKSGIKVEQRLLLLGTLYERKNKNMMFEENCKFDMLAKTIPTPKSN